MGLCYILLRSAGKYGGVYLGSVISRVSDKIKYYLGFCMLPQAGVAIALVLAVQAEFPEMAKLITALVLAAVAVNEIIGPLGTKYALMKAGETNVITQTDGS